MKPRDIVQYFEDRGFLANYCYDEKHRGCLFLIHKGGHSLSDTLYYTEDPILFVNGMVKRFAELYYQKEGENKWTYITSASPNYKNRFQEECTAYCKHDVESIKEIKKTMSISIKDVIFNDPATIVFWMDGTKTVVKCQEGDTFDPEKGLTMAIAKKVYGNKGSYCNEIKKWCEPYYEEQTKTSELVAALCNLGVKATAAATAYSRACKAIKDARKRRNEDSDT